jgi:DNA replication protein DnaC
MHKDQATTSLKMIEPRQEHPDLEMLLLKKGVFPIHVKARLSDYKHLPAERPAFISGPVGSGKTHMAVAYLAESCNRVLTASPDCQAAGARYTRAVDLFMALRSSFKDRGPAELIEDFSRYKFLVIDDLGTERDTPLVQESIYAIVDYRAGHRLPTIITSNLDLDRIADLYGDYGERLASRIAGLGESLTLKGKDRRWQK